jgi:hypothetical protein
MTLWSPWITGHRRGQRRLALSRCPDDAGQLPSAGGDVVVRGVKPQNLRRTALAEDAEVGLVAHRAQQEAELQLLREALHGAELLDDHGLDHPLVVARETQRRRRVDAPQVLRDIALAELVRDELELEVIPHHETFSTTIQPLYSSTKG